MNTMKLLMIYLTLLFLLLLRGSAMEKEMNQAKNTAGENIMKETVVTELSASDTSFDLKTYFLIMRALAPVNQLDLSSGNENNWNNLTCKILHGVSGKRIVTRIQMWYSTEWMKMLSTLHVKGFFVYFLRELII